MFSRPPRVGFHVCLTIADLTNVPLLNGVMYAKYRLKNGGTAKGETPRQEIRSHSVSFNHAVVFDLTLTVNSDTGMLSDCFVDIAVKKEINGGQSSENFGVVHVNISEFAGSKESVRKYLLLESKTNSALRVKVSVNQTKGDPTYRVPEIPKNQLDFSNIDDLITKDEEALGKSAASSSASPAALEFVYPTNGTLYLGDDLVSGNSKSLPIRPNSSRLNSLSNSLGIVGGKGASMTMPRTQIVISAPKGDGSDGSNTSSTSGGITPSPLMLASPAGRFHRIGGGTSSTPSSPRSDMQSSFSASSSTGVSPHNSLPRKWNAEDIVESAFSGKALNL